ncbi:unnamed protein product [Ceratitis capitata]|uniref:(Mediterranean fruit fly) hypothetical protein n=1 Tax=Ceratitis capitata TaxID=7213 RepID=A0A811VDL5_CERCA|nr:unnamed protein product [Ceratitis capitata]
MRLNSKQERHRDWVMWLNRRQRERQQEELKFFMLFAFLMMLPFLQLQLFPMTNASQGECRMCFMLLFVSCVKSSVERGKKCVYVNKPHLFLLLKIKFVSNAV